ncbi:MAG TPA: SCP2 sterol-binding domain-containing protein, partial [Acidimicrobiales bacterium]|nr:SCP2 sterol-binding domain-containing protein [Acidimicrobiales bacterium]
VAKYPFLSPEWMDEAKKIRDKHSGEGGGAAGGMAIKMNQIITDVPFGDGTINAHMNGTEMDTGHIDDAEVTITIDYDTAKAIFVEGNPQAGMQAFMAGKIKVQGDMTKLMAMGQGAGAADPTAAAIQSEIKDITE